MENLIDTAELIFRQQPLFESNKLLQKLTHFKILKEKN
jgi:hypothetical protein